MIDIQKLGIVITSYFLGSVFFNIASESTITIDKTKHNLLSAKNLYKFFDFIKTILLCLWLKYTAKVGDSIYLYLIIFLWGHHFSIHRKFKNNKSFYICLAMMSFLDIEKLILFLFCIYFAFIFVKKKAILMIFAIITTFIFSIAKQDHLYESILIFNILVLNIYSYSKNIEHLVLFDRENIFKMF